MKEETITISTKRNRLIVRIILFVVFVLIAVISFTYGIVSCSNQLKRQKGLTKIEMGELTLVDKTVIVPFEDEISFYYYIDKDKKFTVDENYSRVTRAYNIIGGRLYEMLDTNYEYDDIVSLCYINNHPNQDIEIAKELYDILADAYNKTKQSEGHYNLFSGRLNLFWKQALKNQNANLDPLRQTNRKELLDNIINAIKINPDNYDLNLKIVDNKYYVNFFINQENNSLYYENKSLVSLDLNVLRDAYVLDNMANYLLEQKFSKGYLTSSSGCYLHLKDFWLSEEYVDVSMNVYTKTEINQKVARDKLASIRMYGPVRYFTYQDYYTSTSDGSKYQISDEDKVYRRHNFYDASSGYPINNIRYIRTFSNANETSLVSLGYHTLLVNTTSNPTQYIKDNDLEIFYITDNKNYDDMIDDYFKIYYHKLANLSIVEKYLSKTNEIID